MKKIEFFIGANNKTGEVDKVKACHIMTQFAEGFTMVEGLGFWQGKSEKSIVFTVIRGNNWHRNASAIAECLALSLEQELVGYTIQSIEDTNLH